MTLDVICHPPRPVVEWSCQLCAEGFTSPRGKPAPLRQVRDMAAAHVAATGHPAEVRIGRAEPMTRGLHSGHAR